MSWFIADKVIWASLCFSIGFAYVYVPATLQYVKDLTVVPDVHDHTGPNKQLRTDAEKAISLSTLKNLSDGYSHEIRSSTLKIVATRAVRSRTKHLLLRDLKSKQEIPRGRAIQALWLLLFNPALSTRHAAGNFQDLDTFRAIIETLVHLLPLHKTAVRDEPTHSSALPPSPICPPKRPAHERLLLTILCELLNTPRLPALNTDHYFTNSECALEAGLVSQWLKHYPFPCSLRENSHFNFKKSDVGTLFERNNWASDDPSMAGILQIIMNTAKGNKQLREAGLKASSILEDLDPRWHRARTLSDLDNDVRMINGESTAGAVTPPTLQPILESGDQDFVVRNRERGVELSQEEERLRRRRREAVVVAEAGVPLRAENILQRQDSNTLMSAGRMVNIWEHDIGEGNAQPPGLRALDPATLDRLQARLAEVRRRVNQQHVSNIADLATAESAEIEHVTQELAGSWSTEERQAFEEVLHGRISEPQTPWTVRENVSFANGETPPEVRQLLQEEITGEAGFNDMIRQDRSSTSRRQSNSSDPNTAPDQ